MLAHLVVIQQALKEAITSSLGPKTSLEFCAFHKHPCCRAQVLRIPG